MSGRALYIPRETRTFTQKERPKARLAAAKPPTYVHTAMRPYADDDVDAHLCSSSCGAA